MSAEQEHAAEARNMRKAYEEEVERCVRAEAERDSLRATNAELVAALEAWQQSSMRAISLFKTPDMGGQNYGKARDLLEDAHAAGRAALSRARGGQ